MLNLLNPFWIEEFKNSEEEMKVAHKMCLERITFKFLEGKECEKIQKLTNIFKSYFSRIADLKLEDFREVDEIG